MAPSVGAPNSAIRDAGLRRFSDSQADVAWLKDEEDKSARVLAKSRPWQTGVMISNTNTGSASAPGASLLSKPEQTGIANVNQTVRAVCPLPQQALALLAPQVHLESLFLFADFGGKIVDQKPCSWI